MRHQQQLVRAVEADQRCAARAAHHLFPPALEREHAFDEVLPDVGVVEAPLLLHGKRGKVLHEGPGEHPDSFPDGHAALRVHLHPHESAAGGVLLEDEAAQVFGLQFPHAALRPAGHQVGAVLVSTHGHQARALGVADQSHRFPGHAQTGLGLGAYRHVLHEPAEFSHQELIEPVAAVVAHGPSQEAGAHSQADRRPSHAARHVRAPTSCHSRSGLCSDAEHGSSVMCVETPGGRPIRTPV